MRWQAGEQARGEAGRWVLSCSAEMFGSHPEDAQGAAEGFETGTEPDQVCISGGKIDLILPVFWQVVSLKS